MGDVVVISISRRLQQTTSDHRVGGGFECRLPDHHVLAVCPYSFTLSIYLVQSADL